MDLSCGVRIEQIPEWVKNEEAIKDLSWQDRTQIKDATWALVTEYEADALGSIDPDWQGSNPRDIQSSVDEKFVLASVALWLAKPSTLTCGPVLHFDRKGESKSIRRSASFDPVLISDNENDNIPNLTDIAAAGQYLKSIFDLRRDATVWIAIRMLVRAITESMWEGKYLWQWIVLEALFGPDSPAETTHRLAQRISLFLEDTPSKRRDVFKKVKKAYGWRSKLVHGAKLSKLKEEQSEDLTTFTEATIRSAFQKILNSPKTLELFDGKDREEYLESLAFGVKECEASESGCA